MDKKLKQVKTTKKYRFTAKKSPETVIFEFKMQTG